ncbi:ATP synthase F1 subunit gamma [bacterium]|nr:ATP synthase F1 subunit gamma [bacterium]
MASDRELKTRIKSVESIGQITGAMKMVASSQIRKVEQLALEGRAYADCIRRVVRGVSKHINTFKHPVLELGPVEKIGVIVIGGDSGLCGPYNSNLARHAVKTLKSLPKKLNKLLCLGGKADKALRKAGYTPDETLLKWEFSPELADNIVNKCREWYENNEADEILVVYTNAITMLTCETRTFQLVPLKALKYGKDLAIGEVNDSASLGFDQLDIRKEIADKEEMLYGDEDDDEDDSIIDYIFEPSIEEALTVVVRAYFRAVVMQLLLESKTSELGSRVKAMSNATDNAKALAEELTLQYYRVRQESITNEIIEISSGAEALKG